MKIIIEINEQSETIIKVQHAPPSMMDAQDAGPPSAELRKRLGSGAGAKHAPTNKGLASKTSILVSDGGGPSQELLKVTREATSSDPFMGDVASAGPPLLGEQSRKGE